MVITFVYASALFCDIYFKAKSSNARLKLLFLPLSIIILSTGFLLELSTHGVFIYTHFSCLLIYIGLCFMGYSWFIFSQYVSYQNKKKVTLIDIISLLPAVSIFILILTNPLHKILYIVPHTGEMNFNLHYILILLLEGLYVIYSTIVLISIFLRNNILSKKLKITFFIVLALVPFSFYMRILYIKHIEIVPLFLLIGYHIILYSSHINYRLFDIIPRSIASIVENMDQSILLTNKRHDIVNFNASFIKSFGSMTETKEAQPLNIFVDILKKSVVLDMESKNVLDSMTSDIDKNISGNIHVHTPIDKWYFVLIQNVPDKNGKKIGKLISFNDITTIHNLNENLMHKNFELQKRNQELKKTNEKILKHTLMSEELAITRERNRILSELHDTIGQAYTSNLALARCTETLILSDRRKEALDSLEEMASTTKELLLHISSCVNDKSNLLQQPLKDALEKLFKSYRKSGITIKFDLKEDLDISDYKIHHTIYRICQESINNSLKHGMAKKIYISINISYDKIILQTEDDGIGCDSIYKGIGLKGIEYRISEIEGNVLFISDKSKGKGFIVKAEIPIRREQKT